MRLQILLAPFLVLLLSRSVLATDRIYELIPDTAFNGTSFGFMGTITTDGSIGYFSDASFIKDWSITLRTTGDLDGISTEVFTPASGYAFHAGAFGVTAALLEVTETSISILHAGFQPASGFSINLGQWPATSQINWLGAGTGFPPLGGLAYERPPSITILDSGATPSGETRYFDPTAFFQIAIDGIAIPEPSTFALIALGAIGTCLHCARRRAS